MCRLRSDSESGQHVDVGLRTFRPRNLRGSWESVASGWSARTGEGSVEFDPDVKSASGNGELSAGSVRAGEQLNAEGGECVDGEVS